MSVESHHSEAPSEPITVHVVVVSSTRTEDTDRSGKRIAELLAAHEVSGPEIVDDGVAPVQHAVKNADARVVILTGGTGLSATDVTAEAVEGLFTRRIPGFGELFRHLSYEDIGSAAWLSRATAGVVGDTLVFALPGSRAAVELAIEKLIAPELAHATHQLKKEGAQPTDLPEPAEPEVQEVDDASDEDGVEEGAQDEEERPPPTGEFGQLGGRGLTVGVHDVDQEAQVADHGPGGRGTGWERAIYEIEGDLDLEKREELPHNVEKFAPLLDVLHTAGEQAVMKLPGGRTYSVWGFPDLRRPHSKVLAVGWGEPLCELLALHRYPAQTGVCIKESFGLLPQRSGDVAAVCEAVTGRVPKDTSGELFAIQGDTVWIQRGNTVYKWDGRRETNDGTPKQSLASMALHWSQR